jgi:3-deoxy-manno-octulosonate cytidylyltransferase (CMP-KDO synthetase)
MNKTAIIIPSHLAAKRLPNKPLLKINNKAMITHVWEKAKASNVSDVFVATANQEIIDEIKNNGGNAILTGKQHTTGSDRIYEAIEKLQLDHDIIINVQGDMPMINPETINLINNFMIANPNASVSTVASKITEEEIKDKNVVKAVTEQDLKISKFQKALNFVREISNEKFYYHHIGLYAYRKNILNKFVNMQKTENEINRSLEQMRFLDHNIDIFVGYTDDNPLSVDTKEDLEKIRKLI